MILMDPQKLRQLISDAEAILKKYNTASQKMVFGFWGTSRGGRWFRGKTTEDLVVMFEPYGRPKISQEDISRMERLGFEAHQTTDGAVNWFLREMKEH